MGGEEEMAGGEREKWGGGDFNLGQKWLNSLFMY